MCGSFPSAIARQLNVNQSRSISSATWLDDKIETLIRKCKIFRANVCNNVPHRLLPSDFFQQRFGDRVQQMVGLELIQNFIVGIIADALFGFGVAMSHSCHQNLFAGRLPEPSKGSRFWHDVCEIRVRYTYPWRHQNVPALPSHRKNVQFSTNQGLVTLRRISTFGNEFSMLSLQAACIRTFLRQSVVDERRGVVSPTQRLALHRNCI